MNKCKYRLQIIALSAVLAVSAAGLLPQPHYNSAAAVSSQNIVRHDEQQVHAAPVAYHGAPAAYHAAPVAYHAAPVHYAAQNEEYVSGYNVHIIFIHPYPFILFVMITSISFEFCCNEL